MDTKIFSLKQNNIVGETTVKNCWKNPVVLILSDSILSDDRISDISGITNPLIEARIHLYDHQYSSVLGYSYYIFNK